MILSKNIFTYLIFTLGIIYSSTSFSQTVNNIPLEDIDSKYINIEIIRVNFKGTYKVYLDYGQEIDLTIGKNRAIMEDGKDKLFYSEMDAINFLYKNYDYKLKQVYSIQNESRTKTYHLLEKVE